MKTEVKASKIYKKLCGIVEPTLKYYQDDLHIHDKKILSDNDKSKSGFVYGFHTSGTFLISLDFTKCYPTEQAELFDKEKLGFANDFKLTSMFNSSCERFLYSDGADIFEISKSEAEKLTKDYFDYTKKLIDSMLTRHTLILSRVLLSYKEKHGKQWKSKMIKDHWNSDSQNCDDHVYFRVLRNHFSLSQKDFANISKASDSNMVQEILVNAFLSERGEGVFAPEEGSISSSTNRRGK